MTKYSVSSIFCRITSILLLTLFVIVSIFLSGVVALEVRYNIVKSECIQDGFTGEALTECIIKR